MTYLQNNLSFLSVDDNDFYPSTGTKLSVRKGIEYIVLHTHTREKSCSFKFCVTEICDMILNPLKDPDF